MQITERIAIVGGGPGGLVLARLLHLRGIPATIFELDEHPLARPQGGSLDLHTESGLRALREAGLEAAFLEVARYDDQADAIYDADGTCHFREDGGHDRPEIDRTQLRAMLLDALPTGAVRWNSKVTSLQSEGDRWRVVGSDGADLGVFDLVVGADGAWSKVRPLLSAQQPASLGLLCYELMIDDVDTPHPDVAALLPHGKVTVVGAQHGFIAQRSSGGHVRVYVMVRVPEAELDTERVDLTVPARAREQLKALLGFAPSMLAFIDAANDTITRRPIVGLPVGHAWDHRRGLTLVGDAAHVMSPFSGEGVNMALLDGLELALALTSTTDLDEAVRGAEERMFKRAAAVAAGANRAATIWPAQLLRFIAEGGDPHAAP
jgi:2-polyprenyl-6-methoxyphenol hydroxylase-like FAD-dependent oxidoreductase